jgi:NitT/TauT family transport system ATP-binding protein
MAAKIEIRDVSKVFDPVRLGEDPIHAFGPVDLTVEPGAFVTFLGPSGCGKSTLLLMIAGLLPPSHGAIRIDGASVTEPRTDIGIMFQDNTLVPWRSVRRNIELQLELRGLDPRRYAERSRIGRPTSFRVACSSAPPSARRSFTSPRRCFSTSRSASSTR